MLHRSCRRAKYTSPRPKLILQHITTHPGTSQNNSTQNAQKYKASANGLTIKLPIPPPHPAALGSLKILDILPTRKSPPQKATDVQEPASPKALHDNSIKPPKLFSMETCLTKK